MIYCFDLDGTLCSHEENYMDAKPNKARIAKVNRLYDEGNTIMIDSARGSKTGINWFNDTLEQLKGWGLKFHHLRVGTKFAADLYVDDRGRSDEEFFG